MSAISEYLASLRGKKVAVVGIGVSNTPLIKMLLRANVKVTACDRRTRDKFDGQIEELESLGAKLYLGEDYLAHLDHDIIFRTPGLRPDVPELLAAKERGSILTSEMEVFFQVCPCRIIGVTGSDGKTTTTTLIAEFLKAAGHHVYVGGNIGKPLLADTAGMVPEDIVVLELSSFQLLTMKQSPQIAVVTNLAPNHLDVHTSMSEYIAAKENIFRYQSAQHKLVVNGDNAITKGFIPGAVSRVVQFSRQSRPDRGVYLRDSAIWLTDDVGSREVLPVNDILLPGIHNVENYMAAIAAVDGLVSDEVVRKVAGSFAGVEHRIELVRTLDGVRYYNDSIGTSPSRTMAGLRSFDEKIILIAGGYDKHIPFDSLGIEITDRVKELILTGDTADKISRAVELAPGYQPGCPGIHLVNELSDAVQLARSIACPGDVVLLSPACAAFDRFRDFMERGRTFKALVNQL